MLAVEGTPPASSPGPRTPRSSVKKVDYNVEKAFAALGDAPTDGEDSDKRGARIGVQAGGVKKPVTSPHGPRDSGKGVRIQGGKVYDSASGVTCHWCRQKTLEAQVQCTRPTCGSGSRGPRMPTSFCGSCLRNRHGEDVELAIASGAWVCPPCRGGCGPGCNLCCNCSLCRKKAGLPATGQVLPSARRAGFSDVHDYLVHLNTGEGPEAIAGRKEGHPWGQCKSVGGVARRAGKKRRASELDSQGKRDTSAGGSPDTADGDGSTDGDAAADELQTPKAQILRAAAAAIGLGLGW